MLYVTIFDDSDDSVENETCAFNEYIVITGSGFDPEIVTTAHANGTIQLTIKKGA